MPETPIYTIGYGARDMHSFLGVLQSNQIQYLIDVRSSPYSRYKPEFSKHALQTALRANGIRYLFLGDTLGGRPADDACYTDGKPDYEKLAGKPAFQGSINRLLTASHQGQRVALMCSEGKPENCHRSKLIGQVLTEKGIEVLHIDEVDAILSQKDILLRMGEIPVEENHVDEQLSLPLTTESTSKGDINNPVQVQKESCQEEIPDIGRVLQQVFGYPHFRPLQEAIIENVLCKRDSLAVMPTGSGKSLCYQLPATLFPGLTVVVSPLISLMEDQVLELREWGIPAVYLNSTLSHAEYVQTTTLVRSGDAKMLYAAPETLLRPETRLLLDDCRVDCLVIDEAHCISEWGHDFRPEYRQLAELRISLPEAVTLAVTATATERVRQDIKTSLGIKDANQFISSFNRKKLVLSVKDKIDPVAQTRSFLDDHRDQAGIIYCATRDQVDDLAARLADLDYPVLPYHARMDDEARRAHQHRFRYEDGIIMVATIAFGMGINKSNVRFILHYDLPKNIESYYQQIGRAGRDGLPADCLLLYSYGDVGTIRYFIRQEPPQLRRGSEMRLQALLDFLETRTCRRTPLLAYFGEQYQEDKCEACDNCLSAAHETDAESGGEGDSARVDLTVPARQLITCAQETGQIFGAAHLIDVLRASRAKKLLKFKHEKLPSYGTGLDYSKVQWQHLATQFIRQGLLKRTPPHGSLKVTAEGIAVMQGQEVWGTLPGTFARVLTRDQRQHDAELFEQLRNLRARLASERSLPPYVIFHDRSLIEMAAYFPQTPAELEQIHGVGQRKSKEYAPHFLPIIQAYCKENDIASAFDVKPVVSPRRASVKGQQRTEHVWEQHQAGKSIAEIAEDMGFTQGTILKHLTKAFESGKPMQVAGLKESSQISPEDEQRVLAAFEEHGTDRLRPIFDALGEAVSYDQLHLWRLIYQVIMTDGDS